MTTAQQRPGEAAPEYPTHPLQRALPPHVLNPLLRALIFVAIAFDCEARVIMSLDHDVDAVRPHRNLRRDVITLAIEPIEQFALDARFAQHPQIGDAHRFLGKRPGEMRDQAAAQAIEFGQLVEFHRAHQNHAVTCARRRDVEALGERVARQRRTNVVWRADH